MSDAAATAAIRIGSQLLDALQHRDRCDQAVVDAENALRIARREQSEAAQQIQRLTIDVLATLLCSEYAARSALTKTGD